MSTSPPNPRIHTQRPTMSSSSSAEHLSSPPEIPHSYLPKRRRSMAPSPSSTKGSPHDDATANIQNQPQHELPTYLEAEYQSLSPALRQLLPMPGAFIVEQPPIPTTEQEGEVEEPPSEFYTSSRIRERVFQNRERLNRIRKGEEDSPAAQLRAQRDRLYARDSLRRMAAGLEIDSETTNNSILPPLRIPHLKRNEHQMPGYSAGIDTMPPTPHDPSFSYSSSSSQHFPNYKQEANRAAHIRHFHALHPRRPLPNLLDPKSHHSNTYYASPARGFEDSAAMKTEDRPWTKGYNCGFEEGKDFSDLSFLNLLKCFFQRTHLRVFVLGLAFLAYGLFGCEEWGEAGIRVLFGVNFLLQARE